MAPPSSRRTGFSRKAQYSVFTGYLLAGAGALLGLLLLGLSLWRPDSFAPLRGAASDLARPAGSVTSAVRGGGQGLFAAISGFVTTGSQNVELRQEIEIARVRIAEAEAVVEENRRLKALLGLARSSARPVAAAHLIGSTATSARRFATIDAGTSSGIAPGMPVMAERGVIGRIIESARFTSRVMLLTDSESVLPVRRSRDNVVAFAEGRGDGLLRVRLINLGVNPLKVGDLMLTSGAGGYFRPGVAVAVISKITPDGGLARLVAEPAATNFIVVEPIHQAAAVVAAAAEQGQGNGQGQAAAPPTATAAARKAQASQRAAPSATPSPTEQTSATPSPSPTPLSSAPPGSEPG